MAVKKVLMLRSEPTGKIVGGLGFFHRVIEPYLRKDNTIDINIVNIHLSRNPKCETADYNIEVKSKVLPYESTYDGLVLNHAWSLRRSLQPLMDSYQPDVISVDSSFGALVFSGEMNRLQYTQHTSQIGMCTPGMHTLNGLTEYMHNKLAVDCARSVIAHSEWTANMIKSYLWCDRTDIQIFPIGLNFDEYPEKKIHNTNGKLVVSIFARLDCESKNCKILFSAIDHLSKAERKKIEFRAYGSCLPENKAMLEKFGIRYMSFVDGDDKKRAYAETDIVVMPSTLESFGIVGLEALLSNCALLAPRGLGMDSYMPDYCALELNGEALADRLRDFVRNPQLLRQLQSENIFRNAVTKKEFSAVEMANSYINTWHGM